MNCHWRDGQNCIRTNCDWDNGKRCCQLCNSLNECQLACEEAKKIKLTSQEEKGEIKNEKGQNEKFGTINPKIIKHKTIGNERK